MSVGGANFDIQIRWEKFAFARKYSNYPTSEALETIDIMTMHAGDIDSPETGLSILNKSRKRRRLCWAVSFLRPLIIGTRIFNALVNFCAADFRPLLLRHSNFFRFQPQKSEISANTKDNERPSGPCTQKQYCGR